MDPKINNEKTTTYIKLKTMKKLFILLFIPLLFGSCEEILPSSGTVKLEATCQTVPFEVEYHNEHGNDVTETVNTTYWSKEFEASTGHYCRLTFRNLSATEVNCSISIKWKGSVQTSYEGEVGTVFSESISAHL